MMAIAPCDKMNDGADEYDSSDGDDYDAGGDCSRGCVVHYLEVS